MNDADGSSGYRGDASPGQDPRRRSLTFADSNWQPPVDLQGVEVQVSPLGIFRHLR